MATLITGDGGYKTIAARAHAFTHDEIEALLGGPFRVIVLRRLNHAEEVLLVLADTAGATINAYASALTGADERGHAIPPVRGPAVHCMRVSDEGEPEEFV